MSTFRWGLAVSPERYARFAELYVSAVNWIRPMHDEEGRPLGERVVPPALRGDAPFAMQPCPFAGGRAGRPMNTSALGSVLHHWRETLNDLGALRAGLARRIPIGPTWRGLWLTARVVTGVPAMFRRIHDRAIPVRIAAAFKPGLGLFITSERAILGGADPLARVTAHELAATAEHTGALLSHDAACPGSPRMIEQLAAAVLEPTGADPAWLEAHVAPIDRIVGYGLANARLELAKGAYLCQLRLLAGERSALPLHIKGARPSPAHTARLERATRAAAALLGAALPPPPVAGRGAAARFESAWLAAFGRIQRELDAEHPGTPPCELVVDDLDHMLAFACGMVEGEAPALAPLSPREVVVSALETERAVVSLPDPQPRSPA